MRKTALAWAASTLPCTSPLGLHLGRTGPYCDPWGEPGLEAGSGRSTGQRGAAEVGSGRQTGPVSSGREQGDVERMKPTRGTTGRRGGASYAVGRVVGLHEVARRLWSDPTDE